MTKIIAYPGNDIFINTDANQYIRTNRISAEQVTTFSNLLLISNYKSVTKDGRLYLLADYIAINGRTSINIGADNIGETIIGNKGIRFGSTSSALLSTYEQDTYTGTFSNFSITAASFTLRFVRVGNVVTVSLDLLDIYRF